MAACKAGPEAASLRGATVKGLRFSRSCVFFMVLSPRLDMLSTLACSPRMQSGGPGHWAAHREGWQGQGGQAEHPGQADTRDQKWLNWAPRVGREPGQMEDRELEEGNRQRQSVVWLQCLHVSPEVGSARHCLYALPAPRRPAQRWADAHNRENRLPGPRLDLPVASLPTSIIPHGSDSGSFSSAYSTRTGRKEEAWCSLAY